MNATRSMTPLAALALWTLGACEPEPTAPVPSDPPSPPAWAEEARALYPTALAMHSGVIAKTCSPNPGVCHNGNNYPDMHTPGNFLALVDAWCNVEIPDATQGWDGCERAPDWLVAGPFAVEVAWSERRSGIWTFGLRDPPEESLYAPVSLYDAGGAAVIAPEEDSSPIFIDLLAGQGEASVTVEAEDEVLLEAVDAALGAVVGGDSNRNGVFGALDGSTRAALIRPGRLSDSYLWGRITGTVPGTRMPLANAPLTNAEYIAIACWIEGLERTGRTPTDAIDYDGCLFAIDPPDLAPTSP